MMFYTHIATSVAVTAVGANLLGQPLDVALLGGVIIGAILPDIDEPNSKIGRKLPGISHVIKLFYGHRGIIHSLPIAMAFIIAMIIATLNTSTLFFAGLGLGFLLHILEDCFFGHGVPLLKPFKDKRYGMIGLKVGGIMEHLIFLAMIYVIIDVMVIKVLFS